MHDRSAPQRPWFREPMLWLVLALPFSVVVAGFVTLGLATRSGSFDAVPDPVQRVGKAQTVDLGPDRMAAGLGLAGELRLAADTEAIELVAPDLPAADARLRLVLSHPSEAREDLSIDLLALGHGRFAARLAVPRDHPWNLHLSPPDGRWRLQGRLDAGALSAALAPALDEG